MELKAKNIHGLVIRNDDGYMVLKLNEDWTEIEIGHLVSFDSGCTCMNYRFHSDCEHLSMKGDWTGIAYPDLDGGTCIKNSEVVPEENDVGLAVMDEDGDSLSAYILHPLRKDVCLSKILEGIKNTDRWDGLVPADPSDGTLDVLCVQTKKAFLEGEKFENVEDHFPEEITTRHIEGFEGLYSSTSESEKDESESEEKSEKSKKGKKHTDTYVKAGYGEQPPDIPEPENFYVESSVWRSLVTAASNGMHCLLFGPTGSGKSELVYHLADKMGKNLEPVNFGGMTEARISLIGATHYKPEDGTWFKKSRFVSAVEQKDGIILGDEITRAPADAFNLIIPLLDRQGYLSIDETEEAPLVYKGDKVSFLATANVGMEYTGTGRLDRALMDRFSYKICLDYPPEEREVEILEYRSKLKKDFLKKLVNAVNRQRELAHDGEFDRQISTRMLIDCCQSIQKGLDFEPALEFTIIGCFDSEGDEESEQNRVRQVFQKSSLI